MKKLVALACMFAAILVANSETIRFEWDPFQDIRYTGYVLDLTKVPLASGVTNRSQHSNWAMSVVISGITTTSVVVTVPPTMFAGTNWFYLTATGPSSGTNVVAPTELSNPVVAYKSANKPSGFRSGSVAIESTTNLVATIQWKTEEILPLTFDISSPQTFYRARLAINQGTPQMPAVLAPPMPGGP